MPSMPVIFFNERLVLYMVLLFNQQISEVHPWPITVYPTQQLTHFRVHPTTCILNKSSGCNGWVHKRCSGVKGSLVRVEDTFVCKTCEREGDEEDRNVEESLDLGNRVHVENVGKFCYLGDMLNVGGGANSVSLARVHCAWRKFKELSGILTRNEVSFKLKGRCM